MERAGYPQGGWRGEVRLLDPPPFSLPRLPLLDAPAAPDIAHLAWERRVPVLEVGDVRDSQCLAALELYRPDVICVSCFPQILPEAILSWPRLGCLNLHPSLLPEYRGPAPLFRIFQRGEARAGVTIHIMDTGIDSGDILLQEAFALPDGISGAELARECARRGARLMAEAVTRLPSGALSRTPQPEGGSYYSWPQADDFAARTNRPAHWAFNFIRGVAGWGAITIAAGDCRFRTRRALGYTESGTLGRAWVSCEQHVRIQFSPGILDVVPET